MPRPKKKPTTFDGWLGQVIDSLAESYGGSVMMAELTGISTTSIHRRLRGENPFFTSEVTLIANKVNTPVEQIVSEALRRYGEGDTDLGFTRLLSEARATTDDLTTRRLQKEAELMSPAEIEDRAIAAAAPDPERSTDAPPSI